MIEKMRAIEAWLRKGQRMAVALGLALCVSLSASAVVEVGNINDGVDRNDPNFVTSYLPIAGVPARILGVQFVPASADAHACTINSGSGNLSNESVKNTEKR